MDLAIRLLGPDRFIHLAKPLYRHRLYGHNASREFLLFARWKAGGDFLKNMPRLPERDGRSEALYE